MGAIDATAAPQAAAKYEIQSYPAIKLFKKGVFVEDYDSGNMKDYADAISNFLLRHLGQNPTEKAKKAWVDHYAALGLTKEASDDELKKAYRRLSRQYHPDKARRPHPPPPPRPPCPGCSCSCRCCCPAAPALTAAAVARAQAPDGKGDEARLKEVQTAWETLGDAAKRKSYDTYGTQVFGHRDEYLAVTASPPALAASLFQRRCCSGAALACRDAVPLRRRRCFNRGVRAGAQAVEQDGAKFEGEQTTPHSAFPPLSPRLLCFRSALPS